MTINHTFTENDFKKIIKGSGYNGGDFESRLLGVKEQDDIITFNIKIIWWNTLYEYFFDFDEYNDYEEDIKRIFDSEQEFKKIIEKITSENYNVCTEVDCKLSIKKENLIKNFTKDDIEFGRYTPIENYSYNFIKSWIGNANNDDFSRFHSQYSYLGEDFIEIIKSILNNPDNYLEIFDTDYGNEPNLKPGCGNCALEFTENCINQLKLFELSDQIRSE